MSQLNTQAAVDFDSREIRRAAEDDARRVADELRKEWRAVRCEKKRFNNTCKFSQAQTMRTAFAFKAKTKAVSAKKKLLDLSNEHVARLYSLVNEAYQVFRNTTIDFPESGIRLIKVDDIEKLERRFAASATESTNSPRRMFTSSATTTRGW